MTDEPLPRTCPACGRPLARSARPDARYCSPACRTAAWRRRRGAAYPTDPLARGAWEADRRLAAGEAASWLEHLAERIPEQVELRARAIELARELRTTFLLRAHSLEDLVPEMAPEDRAWAEQLLAEQQDQDDEEDEDP